jgi:WbqC-like protein family
MPTEPVSGTKRIAVVQSSYVPWKGFFDLVNAVDEFVLYDDREYSKNSWRNRNRVKTSQGTTWLTIPVQYAGHSREAIDEVRVADQRWPERHWKTIVQNYGRAPCFERYAQLLEETYGSIDDDRLSRINRRFIELVCGLLGIATRLTSSRDYAVRGTRTARLIELCHATGASEYLSGPTAREYLEKDRFRVEGIALLYANYDGYPEYPQQFPPFVHDVSVLDLILNTGPEAPSYMKSFRNEQLFAVPAVGVSSQGGT